MTDSTAAENTAPSTSVSTTPKKKPSVNGTIEENEIRVTAQGKMRNYVAYAATIFSENKSQTVVLKGMGRVINKTVSLAEILKRRLKGLYQMAEIGSIQVNDKKNGKGEGVKDIMRLLSVIKITLTTEPEDEAKYQPPIDEIEAEAIEMTTPRRPKAKGQKKKGRKAKEIAAADKQSSEPTETPPAVENGTETQPAVESEEKKNGKALKNKQQKRRKPRKAKKDTEKVTDTPTSTADNESNSKDPTSPDVVVKKEVPETQDMTETTTATSSA